MSGQPTNVFNPLNAVLGNGTSYGTPDTPAPQGPNTDPEAGPGSSLLTSELPTSASAFMTPKKQTCCDWFKQEMSALGTTLANLNKTAVVLALPVAFAYVCMNRQGSTEIHSNPFRWVTAGDSAVINFGLYYLVFRNFLVGPKKDGKNTTRQKYQKLFNAFCGLTGIPADLIAALLYPLCLTAAISMLEATVAGAVLLDLPGSVGTVFGWYMTAIARALAVLQGFAAIPDTWNYLKNAYRYEWFDLEKNTHGLENSPSVKRIIGLLSAVSVIGSALYVLTMRASVLTALGNPNALGQNIACQFQKTAVGTHLAIQWISTGINYPFYILWISRGLIRGLEPIWNKHQRNLPGLRILAVVLAVLSLAPSAAPLFSSAKDAIAPIIKDGCQLTGHWVAQHTELPFERHPHYQLGAGIGINMLLALFMNISSLVENLGVYKDQKHLPASVATGNATDPVPSDTRSDAGGSTIVASGHTAVPLKRHKPKGSTPHLDGHRNGNGNGNNYGTGLG